MKTATSPRKLVTAGALLALALVAWVNLAPKQLGGGVSYVITYGNSMEPRFHQDDLVIVRDTGAYEVGNVIAYKSAALEQPVMHRIIEVTPDGYVTKGDNNSWTDTDRPTDADVIGEKWVHVPGAGKVLKWASDPRGAVLLATGMALFLFVGNKKGRRGKQTVRKDISMDRIDIARLTRLTVTQQFAVGAVGALALVSLLLGLLSFPKDPVASRSQEAAFEHTGRFSYSADATKSVVYPEGELSTGGPLYLKLIDELTVGFDYQLSSDAPAEVAGVAVLRARLNGSNGWQKSFPLQRPTPFEGKKVQLSGSFDPEEIVQLTSTVQSLTGVPDSYTLSIVPSVEIEGTIGGEEIAEAFSPTLGFAVEGLQLKSPAAAPGESGGEIVNPLEPTLAGSIKTSELDVNRVSLLAIDLPVATARKVSVVGFAAALLLLLLIWQRLGRDTAGDEADLIETEFGDWLVEVASVEPDMRSKAVVVSTMTALVRLADRYERMILHHSRPPTHDYYVEESGVIYRYSLGEETQLSGDRKKTQPKRGQLRGERHLQERARLRAELQALDAEIKDRDAAGTPDLP